jgi:chromosome segregation ATPase
MSEPEIKRTLDQLKERASTKTNEHNQLIKTVNDVIEQIKSIQSVRDDLKHTNSSISKFDLDILSTRIKELSATLASKPESPSFSLDEKFIDRFAAKMQEKMMKWNEDNQKKIDALTKIISDRDKHIQNLMNGFNTHYATNTESLQKIITQYDANFKSKNSELNTLNTKIENVSTKIDNLKIQVDKIPNFVQSTTTNTNEKFDTIRSQFKTIDGKLDAFENLDKKTKEIQKQLFENNTKLANIETKIKELQSEKDKNLDSKYTFSSSSFASASSHPAHTDLDLPLPNYENLGGLINGITDDMNEKHQIIEKKINNLISETKKIQTHQKELEKFAKEAIKDRKKKRDLLSLFEKKASLTMKKEKKKEKGPNFDIYKDKIRKLLSIRSSSS